MNRKRLIYTQTQYIIAIIWHRIIREAAVLTFYPRGFRSPPPGRIGFLDPGYERVNLSRNMIQIISNSPLVVSQVVRLLSIDVDQEVVSLQTEVGRKTPAGDLKQDLLFHISMADT